jgi:hypothetical protein
MLVLHECREVIVVPSQQGTARPQQLTVGGRQPRELEVAANIMSKESRSAKKGWVSSSEG